MMRNNLTSQRQPFRYTRLVPYRQAHRQRTLIILNVLLHCLLSAGHYEACEQK